MGRRRGVAVLAAFALPAGALGAAVGAGEEDGSREAARPAQATTTVPTAGGDDGAARAEAERLSLRQQVGQLVVMRFAGTAVPAHVRRALRARRAAGVILFADNVRSRAQLRALTRTIQRAARGRALIAVDQEGGVVRRIPWASPRAGQPALATTSAARRTARAGARDLRAAGVNVNLAPVADVADAEGSAMADRAFPGGGRRVARLVGASVRAYAGSRVLPTVKHFPGLGASQVNTDFGAATVRGLDAGDLRPFKTAIAAGVPLVMPSHAIYPQLDGARLASQSPEVLGALLRERLGFRGVIVTDALEAKAVTERSTPDVAALRSLRAGADLLLTSEPGTYLPTLRRLAAEARRSGRVRARVRESAARVLALQQRLSGR